jgi:hypothetical protein
MVRDAVCNFKGGYVIKEKEGERRRRLAFRLLKLFIVSDLLLLLLSSVASPSFTRLPLFHAIF